MTKGQTKVVIMATYALVSMAKNMDTRVYTINLLVFAIVGIKKNIINLPWPKN